jgi:hypothetical protein
VQLLLWHLSPVDRSVLRQGTRSPLTEGGAATPGMAHLHAVPDALEEEQAVAAERDLARLLVRLRVRTPRAAGSPHHDTGGQPGRNAQACTKPAEQDNVKLFGLGRSSPCSSQHGQGGARLAVGLPLAERLAGAARVGDRERPGAIQHGQLRPRRVPVQPLGHARAGDLLAGLGLTRVPQPGARAVPVMPGAQLRCRPSREPCAAADAHAVRLMTRRPVDALAAHIVLAQPGPLEPGTIWGRPSACNQARDSRAHEG